MAWYDWWAPTGVGASSDDTEREMALLNLILPFLRPTEQAQAAATIAQTQSPEIQKAVGNRYNRPSGAASSEQQWLQGLGGLSTMLATPASSASPTIPPSIFDSGAYGEWQKKRATQNWQQELASLTGDPNAAGLQSLAQLAGQIGSASTRQQQRDAKAAFDNWMGNQSDVMQGIGSQLLSPVLQAPKFGSAVTWGTYTQPYSVRGGLVANPWYV